MIEAVMLAFALLHSIPGLVIGVYVFAWSLPTVALPCWLVAAAFSIRHRGRKDNPALMTLIGLAAEMRAGQSLRTAMAAVAERDDRLTRVRRLALAGRPIDEIAPIMASTMGPHRRMVEAMFLVADRTGSATASGFEQLAAQAMSVDDLDRERRVAAAPVLLQAVMVGGIPLFVLGSMIVDGRLFSVLGGGGIEALLVGSGALLVCGGVVAVALIAWRSAR